MPNKTYSELLRDPRWQRKRLEVLQRSDFTCEFCGADDRTLNVHHKLYRKGAMPWEYENQELQALCEECHEVHHSVNELLRDSIAQLDAIGMEQVLGYTQGLIARGQIEPQDSDAKEKELCGLSYELRTEYFAYAFLDALWIDHNRLNIQIFVQMSPISRQDLWNLHFDHAAARTARIREEE